MGINTINPSIEFWRGKRVLLTGHSGFKGAWLSIWLHSLSAKITGISLPPITTPNLFTLARVSELVDSHYSDIRHTAEISPVIHAAAPEIVFHLAAQPLVRQSYCHPLDTFSTNTMGTASVLDALRHLNSVRVCVVITTDKVYQNLEHAYPYREDDRLGGYDPYSASKAASEIVVASYRDSFLAKQGIGVATARAGNVIGGGDWAQDRLIPDAMRTWSVNQPLEIRHPQAIRPWQHVLEPLVGYLRLAERLWHQPHLAGAYNLGPNTHEAATVREVIALAQDYYGRGEVVWGDGSQGPHEAGWLALEIAKARTVLELEPRWALAEAVQRTIGWYKQQQAGDDARALCMADIAAYAAAG